MRLNKIWILGVAMGLAGCGGEVVSSTPATQEGLTLTTSTTERLTGTFAQKGIGVVFDSVKTAGYAALTLRALGGKVLMKVETSTDSLTTQILDGSTTITVTRDFAMQNAGNTAASGVQSGVTVEGDATAYNQLMQLPEFALLPHMSRALGAQGFTGASYESALPIHLFAMRAAKALQVEVEPLPAAIPTVGYCNAMTDGSHADWYGNGCFGMCGPGCSPWSWVCGDNCAHNGCAAHDRDCRDGDWWGCYVGFWYVFFANGGCGLTWPW
jgi:hypothetical protein